MKKKILWLILSSLMIVALVLSSCAPKAEPTTPTPTTPAPTTPAPTTPTPTTPTPTPGLRPPEVPKYGGHFVGVMGTPPGGFDEATDTYSKNYTLQVTNEELLAGDWAKGPAGTGEIDWFVTVFNPVFKVGLLAEKWEIPDANTIILHVRKGVHWALNPASEASRLVNGREMTAQDVAFTITRSWKTATAAAAFAQRYPGWFQSATVTDKWTVTVKVKDSERTPTTAAWQYMLLTRIAPPEVIAKYGDMRDWRNSVGTGPFMLTDYVPDSSTTLVRNPNYWRDDPLHPGNKLPYIDQVTWLLIKDRSTQLAATRAAKVDWMGGVDTQLTQEEANALMKTNTELRYKMGLRSKMWAISLKVNDPKLPTHDLRVRQALAMALDRQSVVRDYYAGAAELVNYPVASPWSSVYTPYEKLAPSLKELYEYHPDKAKKLLAEAGFPNGFKASVIIYEHGEALDLLSIAKDNWSKVGVNLDIQVKDYAVFVSIQRAKTVPDMFMYDIGWTPIYNFNYERRDAPANTTMSDDPYVEGRYAKIWAFENIANPAERDRLMKEAASHLLNQTYWLTFPSPYVYNFWQPRLQNYHGEFNIGNGYFNFVPYVWIDTDIKRTTK